MNRPAMPSPEPVPRPIARRPHIRALTVLALLMAPLASCSGAAEEPPLAGATIGGDFVAVDKAGKTVRFNDFAGKWRIVYFGYSFCPSRSTIVAVNNKPAFATRFGSSKDTHVVRPRSTRR